MIPAEKVPRRKCARFGQTRPKSSRRRPRAAPYGMMPATATHEITMKKALLAAFAVAFYPAVFPVHALAQSALASPIILECRGRMPKYAGSWEIKNFYGLPDDTVLAFKLDTQGKTITSIDRMPPLDSFAGRLEATEDHYFSSANVSADIFGRHVSTLEMSLDRISGRMVLYYTFDGNRDKGSTAFDGTCRISGVKF
jgi:hypothetical protein